MDAVGPVKASLRNHMRTAKNLSPFLLDVALKRRMLLRYLSSDLPYDHLYLDLLVYQSFLEEVNL